MTSNPPATYELTDRGHRWPPQITGEPLDAYGPLRDEPALEPGDRVTCWAGDGTLIAMGRHPFNGVHGIHAYATVQLDSGNRCSAANDELEPCSRPRGYVEGMLF